MIVTKDRLLAGCESFLADVSGECIDRLNVYAETLIEYNKKVNLTAITEPQEVVRKHFTDSLQCLRGTSLAAGQKVLDVGSGGGFPGVVLLCYEPQIDIVLMDSVRKKTDFLKYLIEKLGLRATVLNGRAEEFARDAKMRESFDTVTARAVAHLNPLAEYCMPFVRMGGSFVAMKGKLDDEEREFGIRAICKLGGEVVKTEAYDMDGADRHMVVAKKVSHTSTQYPRSQAQISKRML